MAVLQKKESSIVALDIPANHCQFYWDPMVGWQNAGCNCNSGCVPPEEPTGTGNPGDVVNIPCDCSPGGPGGPG